MPDEPGEISTECYILAGVTGKVVCDLDGMDIAALAACGIVAAVAPFPERAHRKPA